MTGGSTVSSAVSSASAVSWSGIRWSTIQTMKKCFESGSPVTLIVGALQIDAVGRNARCAIVEREGRMLMQCPGGACGSYRIRIQSDRVAWLRRRNRLEVHRATAVPEKEVIGCGRRR